MEYLGKLERQVLTWLKNIPHLPKQVRVWIGTNVWWIVLIGAIVAGISALISFFHALSLLSFVGAPQASYFVSGTFVQYTIATDVVAFILAAIEAVLLAVAVTPLMNKQKKGWVLLFATWLFGLIAVFINAVMTLNPFSFIVGIIFGAIFAAVWGYFLFEIHGQFAHVEQSKGVKAKAKK